MKPISPRGNLTDDFMIVHHNVRAFNDMQFVGI